MALDLNDKSGNNNTLTNVNAATEVTTSPPFTPNTSMADLELDSSQYFTAADSASLSITGDMTLQAWIKRETDGGGFVICSKYKSLGDERSWSFEFNASNNLLLFISANGISQTSSNSTGTIVAADGWKHIAVVYNAAAGTTAFYINGVASGTGSSQNTSIHNNTSLFAIGMRVNSGGAADAFFDGMIDEVRVYNVARTEAAIAGDYAQEISSFTNVVAYYPFNAIPSSSVGGGGGMPITYA